MSLVSSLYSVETERSGGHTVSAVSLKQQSIALASEEEQEGCHSTAFPPLFSASKSSLVETPFFWSLG